MRDESLDRLELALDSPELEDLKYEWFGSVFQAEEDYKKYVEDIASLAKAYSEAGIEMMVHYGNMADARKMRKEILDCYEKRQLEFYSRKMKWLRFEYHKIGMKYLRHDRYSLFGNDNPVQVALYIDGRVAGMYAGVLNHRKDCILVPRLAINMDYKFYSPGYVMLCESFRYFLSNTSIRNIDLSVGSEQYKLDLGGIMYSTEIVECCAFPRKSITFASSNA